ncbi:uncharacterized protein A1O9_02801 [Exophiala aquamarina CBS 119918]|uniref:LysM domain-containing protein n=1 Tax=Exophiala aquamarina CBS 119918 TaxID=1182545 RepID=A0A072PN00_9EURO|nr:uncharacterized protein A1O9_02801 [Exophiala aquamarina CBS 119918]KEF61236.1 hypothetical protein A1O9_02801 [Exophiala aquamarina CBS 119918]
MGCSSLLSLVAILTASVSAVVAAGSSSYPDTAALLRRQAPGTPQYDCHANCGGVITIARTENYCENSTFTTELEACLDCALEYDIWQYYGESVAAAAEGCGLDATPVAAANATTNGTASATGSSSVAGSTTSGSGGATTTAATTVSATAASSGSGSAGAASETSSAPAATSSFPGAGNQLIIGGGALAMVPIGAMLVDWL